MRSYLLTTGSIFALFAASHVFITYEHWRSPTADVWSVLLPALMVVLGGLLAMWAFRLTRRLATA